MNAKYVGVLERKAIWAVWWQYAADHATLGRVYTDTERESYMRPLVRGETVIVEKEFCELVLHAKDTVPDELAFEESWMLAEHGFVWLEKPFEMPRIKAHGPSMLMRAFGWSKAVDGWQFCIYAERPGDARGLFLPWSWFGVKPEAVMINRIHEYEAGAGRWEESAAYVGDARYVELNHEIRLAYTLLHLMSQKVACQKREQASALVRQMLSRKIKGSDKLSSDIRIITLRHAAVEGHAEASREVDWQCRWFVKGHWRKQPYRSVGETRTIFIAAYVKGPEDKPLRQQTDGGTVYVARR